MATTPEGLVKQAVSNLLKKTPGIYYHMPVPGFGGDTTLDYLACHYGRFFAVETKAPGKKPTDRQKMIISVITAAGGKVFIIDSRKGSEFKALEEWLTIPGVTRPYTEEEFEAMSDIEKEFAALMGQI
jgi:hypothetical protein